MRTRLLSALSRGPRPIAGVLGITMAVALACQSPSSPATLPPKEKQPAASTSGNTVKRQTSTLPAQMQKHGQRSRELFDAAVAADLQGVRQAGRELAEDDWTPALRPDWRESYATVRAAARGVVEAATAHEALNRFTQMGVACAACHEASTVPTVPPFQEPTPTAGSMLRHRIAAERMWLGLSTPSDAAWQEGAQELAQAPMMRSDSEEIEVLAHRVHALAQRAQEAPRPKRERILAEILLSCGECHEALGLPQESTARTAARKPRRAR